MARMMARRADVVWCGGLRRSAGSVGEQLALECHRDELINSTVSDYRSGREAKPRFVALDYSFEAEAGASATPSP